MSLWTGLITNGKSKLVNLRQFAENPSLNGTVKVHTVHTKLFHDELALPRDGAFIFSAVGLQSFCFHFESGCRVEGIKVSCKM